MTVTISLGDWKRLNMEEVFERLEADMYEIWGIAFGEDVKPDFDTYAIMYDKLMRYWNTLTEEDYNLFNDGYNRICKSFGNAYFMFDTDGPEQDYLIYDLIELVVNHKESLTYKRILTKLRNEKLEEDF